MKDSCCCLHSRSGINLYRLQFLLPICPLFLSFSLSLSSFFLCSLSSICSFFFLQSVVHSLYLSFTLAKYIYIFFVISFYLFAFCRAFCTWLSFFRQLIFVILCFPPNFCFCLVSSLLYHVSTFLSVFPTS